MPSKYNPFGIETEEYSHLRLDQEHADQEISNFADSTSGSIGHFLSKRLKQKGWRNALIIIFIFIALFAGRSAQLQVIQGEHYRQLAEGNSIRQKTIAPDRGVVYDRNGNLLIENIPAFSVQITAADLPEEQVERDAVLDQVSSILNMPRGEIEAILLEYQNIPLEAVPIARGVGHEKAMGIASQHQTLPGVQFSLDTLRSYATDAARSLSHILGFTGQINVDDIDSYLELGYLRTDEVGKQGIELTYESQLRGQPGMKIVEVDALGNESSVINEEPPINGENIILSVDSELQSYIEMRLSELTTESDDQKMAIVALDPSNGEVLALVSLPSFDSNDFATGIDTATYSLLINDENQPLFPRAIAGEYPSGSTFKPVVAAAALSEGLITQYSTFLSAGGLAIKTWFFPDWKAGGHGLTDVRMAISESVNTFFYIIGGGYEDFIGLGVDRITEYARSFGFGSVTGIDLVGEAEGFLPSKEWKQKFKNERWYVGDTYHLAIGQGDILVTPLQVAVMTSVFANGGTAYKPNLLHQAEPAGTDATANDLTSDSIQIVREGMRQAVTSGSARYLLSVPEPVAGKTGTAQSGGDRDYHAWFTGFGPYENPEIVLTILIEEGGEGSDVAVPIARDIFNWWFENR
jgi:penicillin-binding protein 2